MRAAWVQSLCQEDPLEKEMATHSSILAWKIPWTEEPGGYIQSIGSQRARDDWATTLSLSGSLCSASGALSAPRPGIVDMGVIRYPHRKLPSGWGRVSSFPPRGVNSWHHTWSSRLLHSTSPPAHPRQRRHSPLGSELGPNWNNPWESKYSGDPDPTLPRPGGHSLSEDTSALLSINGQRSRDLLFRVGQEAAYWSGKPELLDSQLVEIPRYFPCLPGQTDAQTEGLQAWSFLLQDWQGWWVFQRRSLVPRLFVHFFLFSFYNHWKQQGALPFLLSFLPL